MRLISTTPLESTQLIQVFQVGKMTEANPAQAMSWRAGVCREAVVCIRCMRVVLCCCEAQRWDTRRKRLGPCPGYRIDKFVSRLQEMREREGRVQNGVT